MNVSIEEKKAEAVARMKMLDIIPDAIRQFNSKEPVVMLSLPPWGGLYELADEEKEMVRKFEQEYDALVYMVVRANTEFGLLDALLYVSDHKEEWKMDREDIAAGYPIAYVVNHDEELFSEFGSIGVRSINGGLIRTA